MVRAAACGASLLGLKPAPTEERHDPHPLPIEPAAEPPEDTRKISREDSPHPQFATFSEIPLHAIEPQGWLRAYLERQRDGLTGHLDKTGGFPFNTYGWAGPGLSDVPQDPYAYEQTGYWVDGMIRCAYLIQDKSLIEKATAHTKYVLRNPDKDGYLGPLGLKAKTRWPHVVFFRALFAQSSATGDKNISALMERHFLSSPYPYTKGREACSIEAILWAYDRGQHPALLRLAEENYRKFESSLAVNGVSPAMYSDGKPSAAHGVSYNEMAKLGALLYMHTGDETQLRSSVEAYKKLDTFHMLVDGINSSSEETHEVTPLESHETCDISDYTWSAGYLLMATGNADYADKIERACFNAAPGAVNEPFTALQYFSCPNQVIAAHNTNHNPYFRGDRTMAFATAHIAACCSGNVNRIIPNFASRLWLKDESNGLVAACYAPSKVTYPVGRQGREVTITETTRYPFDERIVFAMSMKENIEFSFTVRIPGWCRDAKVLVNNKPLEQDLRPGSFVKIDRIFHNTDEITLVFPQQLRTTSWPLNGIAIERGPLVYSLKIDEEWESPEGVAEMAGKVLGIYNLASRFPGLLAWNVYPKSPWNYSLDIDPEHPHEQIEVNQNDWRDEHPWDSNQPPIELRVPARRVIGWELDREKEIVLEGGIQDPGLVPLEYDFKYDDPRWKRKGDFAFTPQLPAQSGSPIRLADEREMISLVPYGCAKLRLTIFPRVSGLRNPGNA